MDLTVKEQTFKKEMLKNGITVSITDYEQLINIIRTKVIVDLTNSIKDNSLKGEIAKIFGYTTPSLKCLLEPTEITWVNDSYFLNLFNSGYFSSLISETNKKISDSTKINAEKIHLLKIIEENLKRTSPFPYYNSFGIFLHFIKNQTSFFSLIGKKVQNIHETYFSTSSPSYVKASSLTEEENNLSDEEKEAIRQELIIVIESFKAAINNRNNRHYSKNGWHPSIKDSLELFNTSQLI